MRHRAREGIWIALKLVLLIQARSMVSRVTFSSLARFPSRLLFLARSMVAFFRRGTLSVPLVRMPVHLSGGQTGAAVSGIPVRS